MRLGVVFDDHTPIPTIIALARMCERAGIDAVWVAEPLGPSAGTPEPVTLAARDILVNTDRISVGLVARPPSSAHVEAAQAAIPGRLEVALLDLDRADEPRLVIDDAKERTGAVRVLGAPAPNFGLADLAATIDEVLLAGWQVSDLETAADEARAVANEAGRDPGSLGVAALVPVSLGRTTAEAAARVSMDERFEWLGHPETTGIFGTLEECQDRVIALAHAGVTDLLCVLPATGDVHDVIAQLTAMVVGTTSVLQPGSLRSPAPPPPDGWGGRPDRPPQSRVSGGSRRR